MDAGLICLDNGKNKTINFGRKSQVRHVYVVSQNTLVATTTEGLLTVDCTLGRPFSWRLHQRVPQRASSLSNNACMDFVCVDGKYFVSTESGGINEITNANIHDKELSFRHFNESTGFGSDVVMAMIPFNNGNGGASTRSFYQGSQYWQSVKSQMTAGDYVFIQFAHNDEKNQGMDGDSLKAYYTRTGQTELAVKTDNHGTVPTGNYKQYLIKYVNETRAAGCNPVLVSPICRKYFNGSTIRRNGRHDLGDNFSKLTANSVLTNQSMPESDHSMDYAYQMKLVADSMNVPFIDLTTATKELYEKYGDIQTNALFFDGSGSTHLNETGVTLVARLCTQRMKAQGILADNVNLTSELTVSPDSIDLGPGYKGQSLSKQATIKGFELTPESGDITISATKGIDISTDQKTWGSTASLHYDAGMVVATFYVKADIVSDDANINGSVTVTQGSKTINIPVSGKVVKITPGEAQDGVTATWALDNGTESSLAADVSVVGLTSVASMSFGSEFSAYAPQSIDGMSFYKVQSVTKASTDEDGNAISFTITPKKGFSYVPTNFSMKAARFGTDGGSMDVVASVVDNSVTLAENITPNRNNAKSGGHYSDYSFDIANLLSTGDPVTIKVYIKVLANNKLYGFRDIVLTGNFSGRRRRSNPID